MTARGKRVLIGAALVVAAGGAVVLTYAPAMAFLMDIAGYDGLLRRAIPVRPVAFHTADASVPTRWGSVTTRIYTPDRKSSHTAVVFPGVHGGGVDEPRLALFCGRLASTGLTVLCTPLPELRVFRITSRSTDVIEDVTAWAAGDHALAPLGRVALVGVSFSGGLALVAAGRERLRNRLDAVLSIGGHGDLLRTLRYLCTGVMADGSHRAPADYGVAVIALAAVPRLVPPDQVDSLEAGIRTYLEASLDDSPTLQRATPLIARARAMAADMPEPSRGVLTAVLNRDVTRVGRQLQALLPDLAADPALSPERSPVTGAPVFLMHGRDDNVIPSSEASLVGEDLRRRGNARVRSVMTPVLSHANIDGTIGVGDTWALLSFWRDVLRVLD